MIEMIHPASEVQVLLEAVLIYLIFEAKTASNVGLMTRPNKILWLQFHLNT